jgi:hypothetical protein
VESPSFWNTIRAFVIDDSLSNSSRVPTKKTEVENLILRNILTPSSKNLFDVNTIFEFGYE